MFKKIILSLALVGLMGSNSYGAGQQGGARGQQQQAFAPAVAPKPAATNFHVPNTN
jgi:hypothetical protein